MAKFLREILQAREPAFSQAIRQLEGMTGRRGTDVAYVADILARAHAVMRQIGLDPADTTALELYKALGAHSASATLFHSTDDVALLIDGHVVSFNHDDIHENLSKTFELRTAKHVRCQIQHGMTARYVAADGDNEVAIQEIVAQAGMNICDLSDYHEQKVASKRAVEKKPYLLFIGDIFTDAFIQLDEKSSKVIVEDDGKKWLAVPYGQKPKYERVDIVRSVGPAPNAAVSCSRLGLDAGLMAWVGGDDVGKEALSHLTREGVSTEPMVVERDKATSYWYVLRYNADRTMLVKSEKYQYKWQAPKTTPDWVYLSYIGEDSWSLHESLLDYLEITPNTKLVFQPGTFHFAWGPKKLKRLYARAHIVIVNREEAVDITGADYHSLRGLADALHAIGPEIVVITDGPDGSYASHDGKLYQMPNYPDPVPPKERTGAGDAFASTFVAALAIGKSIDEALSWAPINSMNVVQHIGAQAGLLKRSSLLQFLKDAPKNYKIKEIE
ncbi:carbohydrate kinase family protein [Patescibacteria group bacterium]|nr:carbohydrate kinase family protein [Patescibacteria group bacterium]